MTPPASLPSSQATAIAGYTVTEQLYLGSRTAVYRAVQLNSQHSVVIKVLRRDHPTFAELVQFRNQYTIARNLEIPGIVQPYSLEAYRNGYALVMEDCGGVSLRHYSQGRSLPLEPFFAIALQLVEILQQLHQQRVIHKDIKPANVLIHPETQQIKLIDFSIASLLPRETQTIQNPDGLEGTLAYLSPEQTGRMNRGIDYRCDFYSLGITFFELLTGQLPFQSHDPMELVHCHLARQPPCLGDVNPAFPLMLGEIIGKLMAKNAEDRYQSATGLKHDLMKCQEEWHVTGKHTWFELGQRDVSDRFLIPETLYGREAEVQTLLDAFGRVANGASELMLVAGFSGIGKTAIVNEVHKPIVRWNGYFIKGKYDQFNRNIPLSAFVQAFCDLMGQLLSERDQQLAQWKQRILSAVGENGQVLIEVIPELEQIIGKQPPAPELSGSAVQNRFNLLFQKFIAVFTTLEHPLVMFLDDLQWADSASLNLMQGLMSQTEAGYLFIIGAYRDNEVFPAHPLMLTIAELAKAEATVNTLTLKPLIQADVNHLIADTLSCAIDLALPLTQWVYQKTQGNPFFTTQFLKVLHQEGYLAFDPQVGHWQCDLVAVRSLSLTDDVVEFMALQLQKLPVATQTVLKFASCIGAQFDLETLAIVSEQAADQVALDLWQALQDGLILPINEVYKFYQPSEFRSSQLAPIAFNCAYRFLHDRVQQASYSLISDDQKQLTHLKIGQLLLHNLSQAKQEEKIFDIVNHLNIGVELITIQEQRNQLAQLNLMAGKKALTSTAYAAAAKYFDNGVKSLGSDSWQSDYGLTLALYESAVAAEYLNINFAYAQTLADFVLEHTTSPLDRVKLYELQIQMYMAQSEMPKALAVGLFALEILGVDLSVSPVSSAIQLPTLAAIESLPVMLDAHQIAVMRILMAIFSPAYTTRPELLSEIVLTMIDLSLKQGHTSLSAFAYVFYGVLLCGFEKDVDKGYYSGLLALKVLDRFSARELECKVNNLFNVFIRPWKEPLVHTLEPLERASQIGFEMGDIEYASYATAHRCTHCVLAGEMLAEVQKRQNTALEILLPIKQDHSLSNTQIWQQFVSNLLGNVTDPKHLSGKNFDETKLLPAFCSGHDRSLPFTTYLAKCILSYLFGDYSAAVVSAVNAASYSDAAIGLTVAIHNFYYSLALLSQCIDLLQSEGDCPATIKNHQSLLDQVEVNQTFMQAWMVHAPANFEHKYSLVSAEKCRVLGQKAEAIELYDKAIAAAKANDYSHEAAIANELAAKFYLDWGKDRIAQEYMTEAYYGYAHWGATAKVADLETRYPQLLAAILHQERATLSVNETVFAVGTGTSTSSSSSVSDSLDLAAILKASQTLSSEIELSKLLSTLLHTVTQAAGATKCVLMLLEDEQLNVQAIAALTATHQIEAEVLLAPVHVEASREVPICLINSVKRSLQPAVIIDAAAHPQFAGDVYIHTRQIKSILCSPILYQCKLLGMVYLENNVVTGAFTRDRVELLNLLCSQAAISLKNARLYEREQEKSRSSQVSLEQLKQTEATLFQEREFLNAIIHNITDGIVACDASGKLTLFNQATREFHGLPVESLPAEQWAEHFSLYQPDGQTPLSITEIPLFRALQGEIVENAEMVIAPNHGSRRILLASGQAIFDPWGNKAGAVVVMRDISDLKQAEIALQQKSHALGKAFTDLQNAQLQIVQSEKMSALGNLVAGVAHEINNPVGFIAGNLKPALDYVKDTFGLLDLYQQEYPNPSAAIQAEIEAIDLDYVREDLPKLVASMQLGVDRIRSISTSLRTFSRADKEYKVPFNIHEGIDSTILILKHRLKANEQRPAIEVMTHYGDLPQIECFPGQLNQVFMNLLANAIDALDESNTGRSFEDVKANPNRITITTSVENSFVKIAILDNGKGMEEQVKSKIFDHLFTTKAVGKGTGLGLAISYQIVVEKHGGSLEVQSEVGRGTEFCVRLPIRC